VCRWTTCSYRKIFHIFWTKLAHLLFGASEQLSHTLQSKQKSAENAFKVAGLAKAFYNRQRSDEAFDYFYDKVLTKMTLKMFVLYQLKSNKPALVKLPLKKCLILYKLGLLIKLSCVSISNIYRMTLSNDVKSSKVLCCQSIAEDLTTLNIATLNCLRINATGIHKNATVS